LIGLATGRSLRLPTDEVLADELRFDDG
jgi:hypothetical protein